MKGTVIIKRQKAIEIWNVGSGNFSIFHRNSKDLLNFWVEAGSIGKGSQENRSELGISLEVLFEIQYGADCDNFIAKIPYIEVPALGELEKYKEYQNKWGEDKDLYYNIYYDEHIDLGNGKLYVSNIGNKRKLILEGNFNDRCHEGYENTKIEIEVECELNHEHIGLWTR